MLPRAPRRSTSEVARVFCPNCGTQNPDTGVSCTKCSFQLKGAAAPKFKGTMLMNQPPAPRPQAVPAPPAAPQAPQQAPAQPAPPAAQGGAMGPPGAVPPSKLKGTMVGVGMPQMGGAPGFPPP